MHWSFTISIIMNVMKIIISICWSDDWMDLFLEVWIDKHRKWFMQCWFVCINTNFETWMWKQFIVWGMGTLWRHQQMIYQLLVTYHENFGKKYLWFLQVLQFVETIFQNKCYQDPFMSFIWKLWMFWCEVIMWHKGEENGLEGGVLKCGTTWIIIF